MSGKAKKNNRNIVVIDTHGEEVQSTETTPMTDKNYVSKARQVRQLIRLVDAALGFFIALKR